MRNTENVFQIVVPNDEYFPEPISWGSIVLPLKNCSSEVLYVEKIVYNQNERWTERSICSGNIMYCGMYAHNRETPVEAVLGAGVAIDIVLFNDWYLGKTNNSGKVIENPSATFNFCRFNKLETLRVIACNMLGNKPIKDTEKTYPVRGTLVKKQPPKKHFWERQKPLAIIFE